MIIPNLKKEEVGARENLSLVAFVMQYPVKLLFMEDGVCGGNGLTVQLHVEGVLQGEEGHVVNQVHNMEGITV